MCLLWDRTSKKLDEKVMPAVTDFDRSKRDGTESRGKKRMLRSGYAEGWGVSVWRDRENFEWKDNFALRNR